RVATRQGAIADADGDEFVARVDAELDHMVLSPPEDHAGGSLPVRRRGPQAGVDLPEVTVHEGLEGRGVRELQRGQVGHGSPAVTEGRAARARRAGRWR